MYRLRCVLNPMLMFVNQRYKNFKIKFKLIKYFILEKNVFINGTEYYGLNVLHILISIV